jgi:peroxiredoxin Q/BCP
VRTRLAPLTRGSQQAAVSRYGATMLKPGDKAPDFTLLDQNGEPFTLSKSLKEKKVWHFVYFYPKADTPGCTKQACGLNDVVGDIGDTVILGISPDKPSKQAKFAQKYGLGFQLLSDPDHATAEAFDVWKEKSMYGRKFLGIERSAFLVDEQGKVLNAWYKVSPADTPKNLLAALA